MTVVAIVGSTATGKSELALAAARARGGVEIVSVDSMQVYRGMDIGTAKPTRAERDEIAHHLIDLVEPTADFTVADYGPACRDVRAEIAGRSHHALLVGGTGLYARAALGELSPPGEWPAVRAELDAAANEEGGVERLHTRLVELDPAAAAKMTPTNRRRVVRALEVTIGGGRPFSSFGPGLDAYPPTDVVQIGLRTPRALLVRRIEERYGRQLDGGFIDEVRALAGRSLSRTAGQALGYKELLAYVRGTSSLDEAVALAVARTRRFAVRQERWFRRDPRVRWVDIGENPLVALPIVLEALGT